MPLITLKQVGKTYEVEGEKIHALSSVNLEIEKGEFVGLVGPSGSGKSTLLHLIGGLDKPTSGEISVDGTPLEKMSDRALSRYRNSFIGFVFQDFHLHDYMTILENVEIPMMFGKRRRGEKSMAKKAKELLEVVGLSERLKHRPNQVSGGQKQRAAIARALINEPKIILADEPTGNLDSVTGGKIIDLLKKIHSGKKVTILVATHDREIARRADRIIEIKDGALVRVARFEQFTSSSVKDSSAKR